MSKPVILTGLRTNSEYHLGNYLGAILPMVNLQKEYLGDYQVQMFAPDLHSFTTPVDHRQLYGQTIANLSVFIAAGMPIDNGNFYLYRQSQIPAHSELTVILNNFAYFGELSRMTQFKEKTESLKHKGVTAGLFDYPVLMASDILLYGAKWIPVGDDQQQHLEYVRDLADRFNNKFGNIFILPEQLDKQLEFSKRIEGVRIRSLKYPEKKMSKSISDPAGTIKLSDSVNEAKQKIMSATTDSMGSISWNWESQPGVTNLLLIYELLSGKSHDDVLNEWQGKQQYGALKSAVAEIVATFLVDFQTKLDQVNPESLNQKLEQSESAIKIIADAKLLQVQQAVGLRPVS